MMLTILSKSIAYIETDILILACIASL